MILSVAHRWSLSIFCVLTPAISKSFNRQQNNVRIGRASEMAMTAPTRSDSRSLQEAYGKKVSSVYRFDECFQTQMSPKDCKTYIENAIDEAGGHEVGPVKVKIHTPRSPEVFEKTYWMVEVPTNSNSDISCDHNSGKIHYPYKWKVSRSDVFDEMLPFVTEFPDDYSAVELPVEDLNCLTEASFFAGSCCLKIRRYGRTLSKSGYDINGQCLSCFAHTIPPVPVNKEGTDYISYQEFFVNPGGVFEPEYYIPQGPTCDVFESDIDALLSFRGKRAGEAIRELESFIKNPRCSWEENSESNFESPMESLLFRLYDTAHVYPALSEKIGQLSCQFCYGINDLDFDSDTFRALTTEIMDIIKIASPLTENHETTITIFANKNEEIVHVPTIGGGVNHAALWSGPILSANLGGTCTETSDDCLPGNACRLSLDSYVCVDLATAREPCGKEEGTCSGNNFYCGPKNECDYSFDPTKDSGGICRRYSTSGADKCFTDAQCNLEGVVSDTASYCDTTVQRCKKTVSC